MLSLHERDRVAGGVADAANHEVGTVLGEMSHAVVNALNTIAAASELASLLIARADPAEATEPLSRIESECMRAARLLRDGRELMMFAIEPRRDSVDVGAVVGACAEPFAHRVQVEIDDALPAQRADANALRRAFTEILNNAFQFGATRVRVAVRRAVGGRAIRVEFHDDGPGFAMPVARLFDAFYSTRPAEHSGVGLVLAARIATVHGGRLGVDDSSDGTTFWIELPVHEA